jgi:peptidyl-prolyl cis-trans isomerase A (cyclophilin A)
MEANVATWKKHSLCLTLFVGASIFGFQIASGQQYPVGPTVKIIPPGVKGSNSLPQPAPPTVSIPPPQGYSTAPQSPPNQPSAPQPGANGASANVPGNNLPTPGIAPGMPAGISANAPRSVDKPFVPSVVETILPAPQRMLIPKAVLHTSMGEFTITLNIIDAPKLTQNLMDLVKGNKEFIDVTTSKKVKRPFYNGLFFHRVVSGFLIQGGCPFGTGRGGPGYSMPDENAANSKFDRPGLVAMAPEREGVTLKGDTNGSQFFITLREMPEWNGKFTIIGEVTKGMQVIEKIAKVKVGPTERPIRRVYINTMEIIDDKPPEPPPVPLVEEEVEEAAPAPATAQAPAPPTSVPQQVPPPSVH